MPLKGRYLFVAAMDVEPAQEALFNEVYDTEHVPNLIKVPGLISVAPIDDKQKLQAAMDLGRYLTSGQVAQDVDGFYLAPGARKSVKTKDPIDKFDKYVEPCYITPIIAEWPQIRTIIHPNIQNAIFGKITPADAMAAPEAEISGILAARKR